MKIPTQGPFRYASTHILHQKYYHILKDLNIKFTYNGMPQSTGRIMIEVYKIVKEIYDSKTTGNILKYRDKTHLLNGHNYILEPGQGWQKAGFYS